MPKKKSKPEVIEPEVIEPEVVETINESTEQKPKEFTEEEKKQIEEFYENMLKFQLKGALKQIEDYLYRKKITVEQAIEEVKNKISNLPAKARDVLVVVKLEYLKKWFNQNAKNK